MLKRTQECGTYISSWFPLWNLITEFEEWENGGVSGNYYLLIYGSSSGKVRSVLQLPKPTCDLLRSFSRDCIERKNPPTYDSFARKTFNDSV